MDANDIRLSSILAAGTIGGDEQLLLIENSQIKKKQIGELLADQNIVTAQTNLTGGINYLTAAGLQISANPVLVPWNGYDDTHAINTAIVAAGANNAFAFMAGKTYLTRGGHELLAGQTVFGNGATLKKMPQATSVLKTGTTYAAAATSIDVETPSNFSVGMWVNVTSPLSALVAESTYYTTASAFRQTLAARIISIAGNTITVDRKMDFASGGSMVLSAANGALLAENAPIFFAGKNWSDYPAVAFTWATAPEHITIQDLVFDGDRLSNTEGAWWVTAATIEIDAHYTRIDRCRFQNIASDAVLVSGKSIRVRDCEFETIDGNCTHPGAYQSTSGTYGVEDFLVQGCSARDVLKTYKRGHGYGAFILSNNCFDIKIVDCHVDTCNGHAFGSGFNNTDTRMVIAGCTAKNVTGGAFRASSSISLAVTGCVFKDCLNTVDTLLPTQATPITQVASSKNIVITGNIFEGTPLLVNNTPGECVISGNMFDGRLLVQPASAVYFAMLGVSSSSAGSSHTITGNAFRLKPGDSSALDGTGAYTQGLYCEKGNTFYGGRYGTRVRGGNVDVNISNIYVDQYTAAIQLNNNTATTSSRVTAQGNSIKLSGAASATATWSGIDIDNYNATAIGPVSVLNNTIDSLRATNTAYGINFSNGSNAAQKCTVIGNNIAVTNAGDETIRAAVNLDATSLVAGNRLSKAVPASISTAGIITGLTGNLVM